MYTDNYMSSAETPAPKRADTGIKLRLARDIADLTWRMFVPSIGGTVLGVIADRSFGTKPWLTLAGVIFGFTVVVFLVWQQIRNTKDRA